LVASGVHSRDSFLDGEQVVEGLKIEVSLPVENFHIPDRNIAVVLIKEV
jgi:hypothetical protein